MWRYAIISFLRKEFNQGRLKLPKHLKHIKSYSTFCSWTSQFYNKKWVVHLSKQSENMRANVDYLGKYLKRPPIGETRINSYDGKTVAYNYLDHYNNTVETMSLPVLEFICRLIAHIPDQYFRNIRYYGFLANRVRGKFLPLVYELLPMKKFLTNKVYTPWRKMMQGIFNFDPLQCPVCNSIMILSSIVFSSSEPLINKHKEIANGYFQLL